MFVHNEIIRVFVSNSIQVSKSVNFACWWKYKKIEFKKNKCYFTLKCSRVGYYKKGKRIDMFLIYSLLCYSIFLHKKKRVRNITKKNVSLKIIMLVSIFWKIIKTIEDVNFRIQ